MMPQTQVIPIVACFSGQDPTGGAGLQADIEALASMGAHAVTLPTCLTVQDSSQVHRVAAVDPELLSQQAETVFADLPVAAIKIGLLGSAEIAMTIVRLLKRYPAIPVILDPVLASGSGKTLASEAMLGVLHEQLLPLVHVLTPNTPEAEHLSGEADGTQAAHKLLSLGCDYVLLTGTHADSAETVTNSLFGPNEMREDFHWPRLEGSYHGSGCTLAASLAGLLAQGRDLYAAVFEAQQYTWESLKHGWRPGHGQALPNRFFWAHEK
jgi:hydroxymethylpyrimidine/phosphomethylpyrimidine kinase